MNTTSHPELMRHATKVDRPAAEPVDFNARRYSLPLSNEIVWPLAVLASLIVVVFGLLMTVAVRL